MSTAGCGRNRHLRIRTPCTREHERTRAVEYKFALLDTADTGKTADAAPTAFADLSISGIASESAISIPFQHVIWPT